MARWELNYKNFSTDALRRSKSSGGASVQVASRDLNGREGQVHCRELVAHLVGAGADVSATTATRAEAQAKISSPAPALHHTSVRQSTGVLCPGGQLHGLEVCAEVNSREELTQLARRVAAVQPRNSFTLNSQSVTSPYFAP